MIKQHEIFENKCDYCGEYCSSMYSTKVDGQWYNGHKNCMPKLKNECEEALELYRQEQDKNMQETYESLKRDMY